MNVRAINAAFFALVMLVLAAGTAIAGYSPPDPPLVFFEQNGSGLAAGSLAGVRGHGNAADDIGCWLQADATGSTSGGCKVVSGSITRSCSFDSLNFEWPATAIGGMSAQSQIYFAWNPQGVCTFVQITNDSAYGPKPL